MAKKKGLTHEEKLIDALRQLSNPLIDKKHGILIFFVDDKARSNQSRFAHIVDERHELRPCDILRIQSKIKTSTLKKDKERKNTYNLYIERNNISNEYIKVSMKIDFKESNVAIEKQFL